MKQHAFKSGKCEGGEVHYVGDIPVLTLDTESPYQAGKAQGLLLGDRMFVREIHSSTEECLPVS